MDYDPVVGHIAQFEWVSELFRHLITTAWEHTVFTSNIPTELHTGIISLLWNNVFVYAHKSTAYANKTRPHNLPKDYLGTKHWSNQKYFRNSRLQHSLIRPVFPKVGDITPWGRFGRAKGHRGAKQHKGGKALNHYH